MGRARPRSPRFRRSAGRHSTFSDRLLGIELDDRTHRRPESIARDKIKNEVFAAARLPLLRIPMRREFYAEDIAAQIAAKLGEAIRPVDDASTDAATDKTSPSTVVPACPICGGLMDRKTALRGARPGSAFYSCAQFPACRGKLPIN